MVQWIIRNIIIIFSGNNEENKKHAKPNLKTTGDKTAENEKNVENELHTVGFQLNRFIPYVLIQFLMSYFALYFGRKLK